MKTHSCRFARQLTADGEGRNSVQDDLHVATAVALDIELRKSEPGCAPQHLVRPAPVAESSENRIDRPFTARGLNALAPIGKVRRPSGQHDEGIHDSEAADDQQWSGAPNQRRPASFAGPRRAGAEPTPPPRLRAHR